MFSNLFKTAKKEVSKNNLGRVSINDLKKVTGGGEPVIGVDVSVEQVPGGIQYKTVTSGKGV